ncbi:DUF4145 domain-containing protein [Enterococcus thailandicus]|uniref:DUF4145 domain-containing protein n=1 Tax=Enterococcus thailandicus TaxID=417368 RepID=UPI002892B176|nr:DUF4145 domain-containing protein [Enterococcus thailandicus]
MIPLSFTHSCPFCESKFVATDETYQRARLFFKRLKSNVYTPGKDDKDSIDTHFYKCPHCGEISISINGTGELTKNIALSVRPKSFAKQFPQYIPEAIRKDYEEAYLIVDLSPKASATLSRRCLQGMIRDYWNVTNKNNLFQEITAIQDKVTPEVSRVLKGLKDLGNIGAHMEKDINLIIDIDPDEAKKLLKLIEYLMKEWYINRYEADQLFNDIIGIDEAKKDQKHNGKS